MITLVPYVTSPFHTNWSTRRSFNCPVITTHTKCVTREPWTICFRVIVEYAVHCWKGNHREHCWQFHRVRSLVFLRLIFYSFVCWDTNAWVAFAGQKFLANVLLELYLTSAPASTSVLGGQVKAISNYQCGLELAPILQQPIAYPRINGAERMAEATEKRQTRYIKRLKRALGIHHWKKVHWEAAKESRCLV